MTRRGFDSLRRRARRAVATGAEIIRDAGSAILAYNLHGLLGMLSLCLPLYAAAPAAAQERVLLQEVMPELAGTPLGAVDVAPAPALGTTLVLRKSDLLRALSQAGMNAKGLNIPRSARVTREVTTITRDELSQQAQPALREAVAPCDVREARFPNDVRVATGPRTYHAEFNTGLRNGQVNGAVFIDSGGTTLRVPVVATLQCPPPEISPGMQITAFAVVGHVKASAPAEARQPGRVGEIIRITNRATGASLRGRVIDARSVEVVP